jgi:multidrug resistance efflux pump
MNKRFILLILIVIALLALVVYSKWNIQPPHVSGVVEADEIRLGSRIGGRVAVVHVQEGQAITAGTVLVELEPFDLLEREQRAKLTLAGHEAEYQRFVAGFREEEIAQAKAKVDQLQARLDQLRAGPRKQEIEAARARWTLATSEKKLADLNFRRLSKLFNSNATSQQEFDVAREALEAASAKVVIQQQELELLEAGTREEQVREAEAMVDEARQALQLVQRGYRSEDIARAKAVRDAAQADLAAIQKQKEELIINSPIDGTIEALDLQPGDMVAAGAPVLSMLDRNRLWVRTYIPQSRFAIKVDDRVRLTIDSYPDKHFEGVVTFVARQAEFTPSNVQTPEERSKQVFRVKVDITNKDDLLRPGMMADVWLDQIGAAP